MDAQGELHGPGRWLLGGVQVLCGLLGTILLLTAVGALLWPRDPNIVYERGPVWWGFLLSLGVLSAVVVAGGRLGPAVTRRRLGPAVAGGLLGPTGSSGWRRTAASWAAGVSLSVAGGVVGTWLASQLRYTYGWDARRLTTMAQELDHGGVLDPYSLDYLSRYPNNLPMLAVDLVYRHRAAAWGTDPYTVAIAVNGVGLALTLFAVFALLRRLRGTATGLAGVVLVFVLLGASPWMAVPYTDLLAAPLVVGAVLAAVEAAHRRSWPARLVLVAVAAALLGVGYAVKTTPATTFVALALVAPALLLVRRPAGAGLGRRVLAGTGALVVVAAFFAGSSRAVEAWAVDTTGTASLDTTTSPPPAWWVAMGLTTVGAGSAHTYYGGYDGRMVAESRHLAGAELATWSRDALSARVDELGTSGLVQFEADKELFNWGDGMFFAWGEGFDSEPSVLRVHSGTAHAVQSWSHVSGPDYALRAGLVDGLWLCLVAVAGVGLLVLAVRPRRLRGRATEVALLSLAVLGILVFTLLFQGRSRYLLAFVPLLVVLPLAVLPRTRDRASADAPGAELDGDPGPDGPGRLGDAVVPGPLAGAAHDDEVTVPEGEADR